MADRTKIQWTDATINPIRARRVIRAEDGSIAATRMGWHCEHVSEACRNCYAEAINRDRFGTGLDYKPGHLAARGEVEIVFADKAITDMLRWRRPRRIFVCSMTDLFADFVPDEMIDRVFAAMALAPQHTFQVLTKRPERMREYVGKRCGHIADAIIAFRRSDFARSIGIGPNGIVPLPNVTPGRAWWPLPNVWLGVTAERQAEADARIPVLLDTPAAKRFVSIEPMLGPVDLTRIAMPEIKYETGIHYQDVLRAGSWSSRLFFRPSQPDEPQVHFTNHSDTNSLDWVIVGGESGPDARPTHPDWPRALRDQCASAGTAFFFKQWGEFTTVIDRDRDDPDWRLDYSYKFGDRRPHQWLNLKGGGGFYDERFHVMRRVGKARAGDLLDGVQHHAFPTGA